MAEVVEAGGVKTTHFVLIHGMGGGAWCWYKVRCLMENSGYKVSCLDLKGAGIDPADPNSILTFDDYNQPLMDFMAALPDDEQVILVGYSAGGLSVTQASHKFSGRIRAAVYLAATMLRLGFCTDEDVTDGLPQLAGYGDVSHIEYGLGADHPPTTVLTKKEFLRRLAFHASPQEDSTLAAMLQRPGPILALREARFEEGRGVDAVPRVYIKTLQDRVLSPEQQDAMMRRWPPSQVYALDSDHSPFFSSPFLLSGLLVKVAAAF